MADGWFTADEAAEQQRAFESELIRRFENGEPLTNSDKREARKLIKARDASNEDAP